VADDRTEQRRCARAVLRRRHTRLRSRHPLRIQQYELRTLGRGDPKGERSRRSRIADEPTSNRKRR
jgi:hypothetical protein